MFVNHKAIFFLLLSLVGFKNGYNATLSTICDVLVLHWVAFGHFRPSACGILVQCQQPGYKLYLLVMTDDMVPRFQASESKEID